jgi:hypothetical protein
MDDAFWKSAKGVAFLKAQAWHEAGKPYPAPDADWLSAQKRVLSGVPTANTVKKATVSLVSGAASGAAAGTQAGLSLPVALAIGLGIALAVFLVWKFKPRPVATDVPHPEIVADAATQGAA